MPNASDGRTAMSSKRSRLNCWGYLTALTRACLTITVDLGSYRMESLVRTYACVLTGIRSR